MMAKHIQKTWLRNHKIPPDWDAMGLKRYEIMERKKISRLMHSFKLKIFTKSGNSIVLLMAICERGPYKPRWWGRWGINPASWRNVTA